MVAFHAGHPLTDAESVITAIVQGGNVNIEKLKSVAGKPKHVRL